MSLYKKIRQGYKFYLLPLIVTLFLYSCSKSDNEEVPVNKEIYEIMQEIYLWYEYVPDVNISLFNTPYELMDVLRYKTLDKWSVVLTRDEFDQYFNKGEMIGHGFLLGLDNSNRLRIAFVYTSTQAYEKGIRRSWIVRKINDVFVTPENYISLLGKSEIGIRNKFEFITPGGEIVSHYLTKEVLEIKAVLHYEILNIEDKNTGYMVFQDFIESAIPDIDETFASFINNNLDELIIDLRYNGGGSISVATHIAGWLYGNAQSGKPLIKLLHNDKFEELDTIITMPHNEKGLNLDRVFFIGSNLTASASELLINGLEPFTEVILIGDNTHGKPVGMYTFSFTDYNYTILPVCFRFTNSNDEGDFYSGLVPDSFAEDDLTKDFGDPQEDCLEVALNYIKTGIPPVSIQKSTGKTHILNMENPVNNYLRAY